MLYLNIHPLRRWAAILGLSSHWTFFIHGDHHMKAPIYGSLFLALILVLYFLELHIYNYDFGLAIKAEFDVIAAYILSLFTSITVYSLIFHPLYSFPGPLGARISKIWHAWHARHSQNHLVLENL